MTRLDQFRTCPGCNALILVRELIFRPGPVPHMDSISCPRCPYVVYRGQDDRSVRPEDDLPAWGL